MSGFAVNCSSVCRFWKTMPENDWIISNSTAEYSARWLPNSVMQIEPA